MLKFKLYYILVLLMRITVIFMDDFYAKFHQRDYKIDFQRVEMVYYNKSLLNYLDLKTFKYNRTRPAINSTINSKVTMGSELEIGVQFYKFLSNEYRELRGTSFRINCCRSLNENLGGSQILYKCGNWTSCVIAKEITYVVCNFYPDESRLPPLIPSGEYKFQLNITFKDSIVFTHAMYIKVYRPMVNFEKKG